MPSAYQPPSVKQNSPYAVGYLPQWYDRVRDATAGSAGTAASFDPNGGMAAVANRIIQDTEGRGDATMNDPRINAALDYTQGIMNGQNEPYTQAVQNQLFSSQADAGAASEASQAEMLRESAAARGLSPNDPSLASSMRSLEAGRQQQNNANLGNIQSQATLANFDARSQAALNLLGGRMNQLGEANSQYNKGAGYLNQTSQEGAHVNATPSAAPNYSALLAGSTIPNYQFQPFQVPSVNGSVDQPAYTPTYSAPTTGSKGNPVYVNQDPYGGEGAPGSQDSPWSFSGLMNGTGYYQQPAQNGGNYTPPGAAAPQTAKKKTTSPYQFTYQPGV